MSYLFLNTPPIYKKTQRAYSFIWGGIWGLYKNPMARPLPIAYAQTKTFTQRPPRPGAKAGTGWGWLFRYGRGLERGLMARLGGLAMKGRGWFEVTAEAEGERAG